MPRRSARARQSPKPWWQLSAVKVDKENEDDSPAPVKQKAATKKAKKAAPKAKGANSNARAKRKAPAAKTRKAPSSPSPVVAKKTKRKSKSSTALAEISSPATSNSPVVVPSPSPVRSKPAASSSRQKMAALASPVRYDTTNFLDEMKSLMSKTIERIESAPVVAGSSASAAAAATDIQGKYDELLQLRETQPEKDLAVALETIEQLQREVAALKSRGASTSDQSTSRSSGTISGGGDATLIDVYRRVCGIKMSVVDPADLVAEDLEDGASAVVCTHIYKPTQTAVR